MVDMSALVGTVRRLGLAGPPYEVIAMIEGIAQGEPHMRIHLIETDEDVDHPVSAVLSDPLDD